MKKRLFLCGDTHGNDRHMKNLAAQAVRVEANKIIQLGDFGFKWPNRHGGLETYQHDCIEELYAETGIPWWFVPGNHDNYDEMPLMETKPVEIHDGFTFVPRGITWEENGVTFLGMGGAFSIDKKWRTPYVSWWPQEIPMDEEWERAKIAPKARVHLTHDVMLGVEVFSHHAQDYHTYPESYKVRAGLLELANIHKPELIFHGHHHVRYTEVVDLKDDYTVTIHGLGADISFFHDSYEVLDVYDNGELRVVGAQNFVDQDERQWDEIDDNF